MESPDNSILDCKHYIETHKHAPSKSTPYPEKKQELVENVKGYYGKPYRKVSAVMLFLHIVDNARLK